jgi:hypothetical protein
MRPHSATCAGSSIAGKQLPSAMPSAESRRSTVSSNAPQEAAKAVPDKELMVRLADEISQYRRAKMRDLARTHHVDDEKTRVLADLRGYFLYACLCAKEEDPRTLVEVLAELKGRADRAKDQFHAGFFFACAQLLSLRYGLAQPSGEKITYEGWQYSFKATLRRLGIPSDLILDELAVPCPECRSLRTHIDPVGNEAWCENCLHHWGPVSFWRI